MPRKTPPGHVGGEDDAVTLHGMRFHLAVGILPHEKLHPQPLEVDLTAWHQSGEAFVDYRALYGLVASVVHRGPLELLESVAGNIAAEVLRGLPAVHRVRIAVRKPHVPLPGPLAYAEVVITRRRDA